MVVHHYESLVLHKHHGKFERFTEAIINQLSTSKTVKEP